MQCLKNDNQHVNLSQVTRSVSGQDACDLLTSNVYLLKQHSVSLLFFIL